MKMNRLVLVLATCGICLGLIAKAAGLPKIADAAWAVTTALTLLPLTVSVVRSLLRRAIGVDLIALLAMLGALVLHQFLAGAVIALMLAGGQALEDFAESRAKRELSGLLRRAPRFVHRYEDDNLTDGSVEEVRRGDLLLVKPGEIVPVDGVVVDSTAILDEAALTGEAVPVKYNHGEQVRSGTLNAASAPFKLRAIAAADESTYAGIIRIPMLIALAAIKAALVAAFYMHLRYERRYFVWTFLIPVAAGILMTIFIQPLVSR